MSGVASLDRHLPGPRQAGSPSVVVTTVAGEGQALKTLARGCRSRGQTLWVIGDEGTPGNLESLDAEVYLLARQLELDLSYPQRCPRRSYARKNIGYLLAAHSGSELLLETDDDNLPLENFWSARERLQRVAVANTGSWLNVYRYFSEEDRFWPRGFPLEYISSAPTPRWDELQETEVDAPMQQGLVNDDPDVDAIYRLLFAGNPSLRSDRRLALGTGTWCPFNSQNTAWWRDAFPLLYLPATCSFRMTDIWRSLVAQRVAWCHGWSLLFHEPTMRQDRNEHDLLRDFEQEIPGYLTNDKIRAILEGLTLDSDSSAIKSNVRTCYRALVKASVLESVELELLDAWLRDLEGAG